MRFDLPNLFEGKTRHGKPRLRVRVKVNGITRTAATTVSPARRSSTRRIVTLSSGSRAASGLLRTSPPSTRPPAIRSVGWPRTTSFSTDKFLKLDKKSQRVRRNIIEDCLREPIQPGSKHLMRDCPYLRVDATHMIMLRDRKASTPAAANNRLKYLSAMFSWAIEQDLQVGCQPMPGREEAQIRDRVSIRGPSMT